MSEQDQRDVRGEMFERVRAVQTLIPALGGGEDRQKNLEFAAFLSIFHPEIFARLSRTEIVMLRGGWLTASARRKLEQDPRHAS